MADGKFDQRGDPCICGDRESWHQECYRRVKPNPKVAPKLDREQRRRANVLLDSALSDQSALENLVCELIWLRDAFGVPVDAPTKCKDCGAKITDGAAKCPRGGGRTCWVGQQPTSGVKGLDSAQS